MKIRRKLNLFVIFSSLLFSLMVVGLASFVGATFLAQRTQQAFQMETYFTLRELDRIFFERSSDIEVLSQTLTPLMQQQTYKQLEDILFLLRNYTKSYQNIVYVDENLVKQIDTNRIAIGQKVDWAILRKAQKENRVIFDFFEDTEAGSRVVSFAKHLRTPQGKYVGYLVCNIPFTAVSRITRLSRENSIFKIKNRVELLREDGEIVYSTYRKDNFDADLMKRIRHNLSTGSEFKFLKQDRKLWSFGRGRTFYTADNLNWFLVMSARESDVYQPLRGALIILTLLLTLVGIIFWIIVSSISKALVRPLERASVAIEKFGHGELKALETIETPEDDLGILLQNLKKMGEQIQDLMTQRAQRARVAVLGEIAGNIAHEINNPLQVISIRLELIEKAIQQGFDAEKIRANIDIASQTVFRISKIVKGLKALSREGDADPFAPVTLQEIIDNVLVLCQGTLKSNMVNIEASCSVPQFKVECRAVQVTQVLLNLVNNAHDAVKDRRDVNDRWIQIKVQVIGDQVEFRVRNSGPKISAQVVQKIFDPFYTTKKAGEGTGLGLSISLKIAKEHAGSLYVDLSDTRTCFVFSIPSKIQNPT